MNSNKVDLNEKQMINDLGSFINYVRMASAVAIIRSKPAHMNTCQYVKTLCGKFMNNQLQWKNKATKLEEEVLSLKQKLIQSQINPEYLSAVETSGDSQPVFPTPPNSSETETVDEYEAHQVKLSSHVHFLRSVTILHSLSKHNGKVLELDHFALNTSVETVKNSLCILQNWICQNDKFNMLPVRTVEHSIEVIVQLLESSDENSKFYEETCSAVMTFTKSILKLIFQHNRLNNVKYEDGLLEVLHILAKSKALVFQLRHLLVKCIQEYSEVLRQVKSGQIALEPHLYENIFLVFQCLEMVLREEIKLKPKDCSRHNSFNEELASELERSLLHISEVFPLFSQYVWHIGGLIKTS